MKQTETLVGFYGGPKYLRDGTMSGSSTPGSDHGSGEGEKQKEEIGRSEVGRSEVGT